MKVKRILVLEGDDKFRFALTATLQQRGFEVEAFADFESAVRAEARGIDAAVINLGRPDATHAEEFIWWLKGQQPHMRMVFMTGHDSYGSTNLHGFPVLLKPVAVEQVVEILTQRQ